ncbi:MAG: hypothetical protein Q8O67_28330 [Deltaproteobacteria bacterium]|nr:hypothetical protein [Deltaproteobacteria bacterium]
MKRFTPVVVVVVVAFALPAFAQGKPVPPPVVFNLDEDVIEASPKRPEALPVIANGRPRAHKSLIRIRTDFRQEVLSSVARL